MIDMNETLVNQIKTITKVHAFDVIADHNKQLKQALKDLLEQIDTLDGIEFSKDLEPHEAETCWDDTIKRAKRALL